MFCAISQLSDPNNPYYGASIEITHFLKFFKISNFSQNLVTVGQTATRDRETRRRWTVPKLFPNPAYAEENLAKVKSELYGQTEIPFYPFYPLYLLTTVPLKLKIMYFHQLLWFLCYHFLSDFKITFTVTFYRTFHTGYYCN